MFIDNSGLVLKKIKEIEVAIGAPPPPAVLKTVGTGGDYATLQEAIDANAKKILVKNGTYNLTAPVVVTGKSGIVIEGETRDGVKFIQTAPQDVIKILNSDHIEVRNMTFDARTHNAECPLVVSDSNHVTVEYCKILGTGHTFAVFFTGKTHSEGAAVINAVMNNDLDNYNVMRGCEVYSSWNGDSFSFSLQNKGILEGNTVIGGRLAPYILRNCLIKDNLIVGSNGDGIYFTTPSFDCVIQGNRIYRCNYSGIKIASTGAVGGGENSVSTDERYTGIVVQGNHIVDCRFMGITIDQVKDGVIINNIIEKIDFDGIYILRCNNLLVSGNMVTDAGYSSIRTPIPDVSGWNGANNSGIRIEWRVDGSRIEQNIVKNPKNTAVWGIRIMDFENTNNMIDYNTVEDDYTGTLDVVGPAGQVGTNNTSL